ncbi:phosphatase PAP2 family protein [Dactylosporangium fulvum]|uniref:Phosphatase PAP2 family protein n=1 Tax=Dactylosporangium fulvum TaxID=53359 RepID=A0ABY5W7H5_9ACTN|nr:phosphatase PAP2 family protein [Dactylosporangium fulvum]UWP85051.1 phosphatase PAP2 family protein [Dactylosporangium fulvum]
MRSAWRIPPIAAASAFAVLTTLVAARTPAVLRFDLTVSDAARRFTLGHERWRTLMSIITHSADTWLLSLVGLVSTAALLLLGQRRAAVFLLTAWAGTALVRLGVLHLVDRARPVDRLTPAAGWSFPSGHTMSAGITAGVAIVIVLAFLPREPLRTALVVALAGWAVLVGISRVALAAHWPTDVLGGWLLSGAVVSALALTRLRPAPCPPAG